MTKIISLTNEVYGKLKKLKKNRSFSKQINELIEKAEVKNNVKDLREFLGLWGKAEAKSFLKEIESSRKSTRTRYYA